MLTGTAVVMTAVAVLIWTETTRTAPVDYVTAPVTTGNVASAVTASGSVNPVVTVQVGSYVSGIIKSLSCDYNTRVRKGQLCAKIDPRPYETTVEQDQANLDTAEAQLAKDQSNLNYATLSYNRAVKLQNRGIDSQDTLDELKSAAAAAASQVTLDKAAIEQRQAALDAARVNLSYTDIVSPVDGTVVSRNVTVGQTVAASFQTPTLFLIANDLTKMQVDANVSESDIGHIQPGDAATFTVDAYANRTFSGRVRQVRQAPQSIQNVVTYDAVIDVANPDLLLKPGMTAAVRIVTDQHDHVLRVPDRALRFAPAAASGQPAAAAPEGEHVWLLRDGRPVRVPVTVGLDDGTTAEVHGGNLQPGDQVVVSERTTGADAPPTPSRPPRFGL